MSPDSDSSRGGVSTFSTYQSWFEESPVLVEVGLLRSLPADSPLPIASLSSQSDRRTNFLCCPRSLPVADECA